MKRFFREIICKILESRVVRLRKNHQFTVVAVAGSVGKTSTKMAIAKTLESAGRRVRYQEGNYNDRVSVPLVFFGETMPPLTNIFAWMATIFRIWRSAERSYEFDVVVVELGTDGPGQMKYFDYIVPDMTVLTAISPEHMLQFGSIEAVAEEELAVARYSEQLIINVADVDAAYLGGLEFIGYGVDVGADYSAKRVGKASIDGQKLEVDGPDDLLLHLKTRYVGRQGATIALSAAVVAHQLGVDEGAIVEAVASLEPFAGRLQILEGKNGSKIIDDTYNSSPLATKAALDLLYATPAKQKIAILGDMNELGESSDGEHRTLGEYCRPDELYYVVTIGTQSRKHLAPAAEAAGCKVKSFTRAADAGKFVESIIAPGALVLAKGSQNGVFAEEAVKQLLKNPDDATKLVRQSEEWLAKK